MKQIRILILEDDLATLAKLLDKIYQLEERLLNGVDKKNLAVTVLSDYKQVEEFLNPSTEAQFDVILLDRDDALGGSYHALDLTKYSPDKIISISSIPEYNEQAKQFGVTKIVHKDYEQLNNFADKVVEHIEEMI